MDRAGSPNPPPSRIFEGMRLDLLRRVLCVPLVAALAAAQAPVSSDASAAAPAGGSVHGAQLRELGAAVHAPSDDQAEAETQMARHAAAVGPLATLARASAAEDPRGAIVFGYLQSETQVPHLRWHALTHVGSLFVGFDALGNLTGTSAFTGRSAFLRAGGAAQAAGVKFVLVLANFDDSPGGSIQTVMTTPARRANLVQQLVTLVTNDSYCQGISIDLEFSWGTTVRDGVTAFMRELRAALPAAYELSIYTNAIYSASQWNFDAVTGITPAIDYMLYSMYDWASGSTAKAISDFDNCLGATRMHAYLNAGLPPEKLVPTISAYSRRWNGASNYNATGSSPSSSGFTDAHYDVTLNPAIGPLAERYVRGDEGGWYTWNDGTQRIRTFDSLESLEYKVRHALSMQDPAGNWNGRRLGGVGFWSLMWMAETTSIDPRTGTSVARTRTYPHIYQLCHEALARPGTARFTLDSFAGLDPRWRDPNEARDTTGDTDNNSARSLVPAWNGDGNALRFTFDLESQGANRAVLAHELLASPLAPNVTDRNAPLGFVSRSHRLVATVNSAVPAPNHSLRLLIIDALGQVEASPAFSLATTGPRELSWDLSDDLAVFAFNTDEPALGDGNGILETFRPGDLGVYGFVVEGQGPVAASVDISALRYERIDPGARALRINEVRYADPSREFVELHGPAGPLPFGLELRVLSGVDAAVLASFPLFGAIPNDGGGQGFFVLGDPGVPNVDSTFGFGLNRDDLSDAAPTALQLVDGITGHIYDAVVYRAFGGLGDLVRREARGVTDSGPWLGEVAPGVDGLGSPYSVGRFPDGRDTGRSREDFAAQPASPGSANGAEFSLPQTFDFEVASPLTTVTYDAVRRLDPVTAGLPRSDRGGLAWRVVDTAGGGVIGRIGGGALGREPYRVSGRVFVPVASEPAQAIGLGIAGAHGSTFFSASPDGNGYESGYWLVYENRSGVNLADGRPDHPGVWELLHVTHDRQDGEVAALLARFSDAELGVVPGKWADFTFEFTPNESGAAKLVLRLARGLVFDGLLPADGAQRGAFQLGFRENHAGGPSVREGTWVDGLTFERL